MIERAIETDETPRAFISYSWESDAHKAWVAELAVRLRSDGVNVVLDQWHLRLGDQLPQFMETAVRDSSFVLIICTPRYKERSDRRLGGVGYEGHVITAEVFRSQNERKFIPVLRFGDWDQSAPSWLLGKNFADLRGEPYRDIEYRTLTATIHQMLPEAPPIGPKPPSSEDALVRLMSFVSALPIVSEAVFELITSLEMTYAIGGYADHPPTAAGVIEQKFRILEQLCVRDNVHLPDKWGDHYWATGRFRAITLGIQERVLRFLRLADVELLGVVTLLQRQHSDARFGLGLLLGFGDITRRSADQTCPN